MRSIIILGLFFIFISAQNPKKMVGEKVPVFSGITISNLQFNENYFNGKVTLLNFMSLGCPPCMAEISMLSKFQDDIKNENFQILCIAPHTAEQLIRFNSQKDPVYNALKSHFSVDSISYNILPECKNKKPDSNPYNLKSECDDISKLFNIEGYPVTFLIDRNGIIIKVYEGFSIQKDTIYENSIQKEIEKLLK